MTAGGAHCLLGRASTPRAAVSSLWNLIWRSLMEPDCSHPKPWFTRIEVLESGAREWVFLCDRCSAEIERHPMDMYSMSGALRRALQADIRPAGTREE